MKSSAAFCSSSGALPASRVNEMAAAAVEAADAPNSAGNKRGAAAHNGVLVEESSVPV